MLLLFGMFDLLWWWWWWW